MEEKGEFSQPWNLHRYGFRWESTNLLEETKWLAATTRREFTWIILVVALELFWPMLAIVLAFKWAVVESIGLWSDILIKWMIPGGVVNVKA